MSKNTSLSNVDASFVLLVTASTAVAAVLHLHADACKCLTTYNAFMFNSFAIFLTMKHIRKKGKICNTESNIFYNECILGHFITNCKKAHLLKRIFRSVTK